MRLTFSILWFDDDDVYFDSLSSDIEAFEKVVHDWGFDPKIDKVTTPEEFMTHSPFQVYDLIVIDRTLEGYPDGQNFIAGLREHAVYTEVIFYSSGNTSGLWDAIRQNELEGVYVSSRTDVLSKIEKIGRQSIHKVLDLENMRGIVMAEVGELDHLLDEILTIGIADLSTDQQAKIFDKFYNDAIKQNTKDANTLNTFKAKPDLATMLLLCDSDKRWSNFNRLKKQHSILRNKQELGNYATEVLSLRNFLAHGRPEIHPNGGFLFRFRGKEFHHNEESGLGLRRTILKYKSKFVEILNILKSGVIS